MGGSASPAQLAAFLVALRSKGETHIVKRDDKFLKGGTQPFRPLGIDITPDGLGFYICDWNFDGWNAKTEIGLTRLQAEG